MNNVITVEVVYCAQHQQFLKKLIVPTGSTILDVIKFSEIQKQFMEVQLTSPEIKVGIFSKLKPVDYQVKEGDRIEIYRNLYQTPMQARKMRAIAQKKK